MSGRLVWSALDRVLTYAVADEAALLAARDTWNVLAGKVHDDEPLYEERAGAFLEWYALEHRPADEGEASATGGRPPTTKVEKLIAERAAALAPEVRADDVPNDLEMRALFALATSHRSLFRAREVERDGLLLEDLWGGGVFRARERRSLAGLQQGDIFDARLIADIESPPELLLGRIHCVHPREAADAIRKHIERAKREGQERLSLLFLLLRLRVRCERYKHVAPVRVYVAGERPHER